MEGNFTWADRGVGKFTAWAKNQPNNFNEEDCVHALGVKYNYEWNDVKCSNCHQYTCKKGTLVSCKTYVRKFNTNKWPLFFSTGDFCFATQLKDRTSFTYDNFL